MGLGDRGISLAGRHSSLLRRAAGLPVWRSALRAGAVTIVWYTWEKRTR